MNEWRVSDSKLGQSNGRHQAVSVGKPNTGSNVCLQYPWSKSRSSGYDKIADGTNAIAPIECSR
jgi:hypothetical protein